MTRKFTGMFFVRLLILSAVFVLLLAGSARAAGTFRLKSTEVNEVSGAWHVFVTLELPKAPAMPHVPIRFLFTKVAVYERALVDNRNDPVTNRMVLQNQTPSVESMDVDFADGSGKIFKQTRFDFGLSRTRGYEAGEYIVQVRTSDGTDIGGKATITLKGDNPVVDRRAITFNAKNSSIKKVDTGLDGGLVAKNDDNVEQAAPQTGDVEASGTSKPFVPPEAYQKTPEEQGLKDHPKGCGCSVPGRSTGSGLALAGGFGLALVVAARRRRK